MLWVTYLETNYEARLKYPDIWVWLKIKQEEGLRRCWSMFPLARVPFWVPVFLSHSQKFTSPLWGSPCSSPVVPCYKGTAPRLTPCQSSSWKPKMGEYGYEENLEY